MRTLLERSASILAKHLKATSGVDVEYRRGTSATTITAIPAVRNDTEIDLDTLGVSAREMDWVFVHAELVVDQLQLDPQRDDTITFKDMTFCVLADGDERPFRVCDQLGILIRVHTKLVAVA